MWNTSQTQNDMFTPVKRCLWAAMLGPLLAGALFFAPKDAAAQLIFDVDRPRIFSIQERPYRLGHEFQLGVGVSPLDAFYVGAVLSGSYTFHFSDFWAWEIASINYSFNVDTPLEGNLFQDFGVLPARGGGERINLFGTTSLIAKPLFGKLAVWNSSIVYAETFFSLGGGPFISATPTGENSFVDLATNIGVGVRFWQSEALSVRFEIRDYVVFKGLFSPPDLQRQEVGVQNVLIFTLSAALTFSNDTARGTEEE